MLGGVHWSATFWRAHVCWFHSSVEHIQQGAYREPYWKHKMQGMSAMVLRTRMVAKCVAKSTTNQIVDLGRSTSALSTNDLDGVDDGMTEA